MTHLRKMMLEELQRRNYAQSTADAYVHALKEFTAYHHKSPDRLGPRAHSSVSALLVARSKVGVPDGQAALGGCALLFYPHNEAILSAEYISLSEDSSGDCQ